jgi:hypothetical protein
MWEEIMGFGARTMSEYVTLDDARVLMKSTPSPYREKTVPGAVDGFHHEPRMPNVHVSTKCWALIPGDFAEITLHSTPLVGIVYEAAEHHYDARIMVDGENFYGEREGYLLSGYMPCSDGYGRVHWILTPGKKTSVRVEVTDSYNRMLDVTKAYASPSELEEACEFCLSGFILMKDIVFPPPTYGSWCFKKNRGEDFLFTPNTLKLRGAAIQEALEVPPRGVLYVMDLYGQGTLEYVGAKVDHELRFEIFDGGPASPTWSRQTVLPPQTATEFSRRVPFGNRLLIRFVNPDERPHNVLEVYMEGTLRLM